MKIKEYYELPTMVKFKQFYEDGEEENIYGIAYQDYVICACCGGRFELTILISDAADGIVTDFEEIEWVSFNEYIR